MNSGEPRLSPGEQSSASALPSSHGKSSAAEKVTLKQNTESRKIAPIPMKCVFPAALGEKNPDFADFVYLYPLIYEIGGRLETGGEAPFLEGFRAGQAWSTLGWWMVE